MRRSEMLSPAQRKDAFFETLIQVQGEFDRKGIDYRIIGSLASHAYLGPNEENVASLDYNRKGAATPDQKVPDIDLIVPRSDLKGAREMRSRALKTLQPVKLGLANPTTDIDFRPNEPESFLTHKDIALPVDSDLFRIEEGISLEDVPIQTVPINTLIHTFGTFGGIVRRKDISIIEALKRKSDEPLDPRMSVFRDFQDQRRVVSPVEHHRLLAIQAFNERAPRRVRNELYRVALVGADMLGKR